MFPERNIVNIKATINPNINAILLVIVADDVPAVPIVFNVFITFDNNTLKMLNAIIIKKP